MVHFDHFWAAKKLLHMTAKEQHNSLRKIFAKVDRNNDLLLEYEEIHQWMHKLEEHIVRRDVKISVILDRAVANFLTTV